MQGELSLETFFSAEISISKDGDARSNLMIVHTLTSQQTRQNEDAIFFASFCSELAKNHEISEM
jgi:hypothetical protein